MDVVTLGMAKAAAKRYAPVAHLASPTDAANALPMPVRVDTDPIVTAADSALPSIYWPWVIKVAGLIGSPLSNYYMYTSTDHDEGPGGIELWKAAAPAGPWTSHGVVYTDTVTGSQTETPTVLWNAVTSLFHMYYQQAYASGSVDQSTYLATSPDGVTWTRVGKVIDVLNATEQPGDGHTGYANVFKIGDQWFAYHLKGGSAYAHFGIATSLDGITWTLDPRPLGYGAEWYAQTGNRLISWNHSTVVQWRGRNVIVGVVSNFAGGAVAKDARMFVAPLSPDLRRLVGPPRIILEPTGWETPNYRALCVLVDNGKLHLYYQTDGNIGLATTEV